MAALSLASCTLDPNARRLFDAAGREVELRPQAMEMLCLLAARPNVLVTKQELLKALWPGMVVTDDSLVQAVGDIRRALGDVDHRIIATVPKRGYRLCAHQPDEQRSPPAAGGQTPALARAVPPLPRGRRSALRRSVLAGTAALCALAGAGSWRLWSASAGGTRQATTLAVLPFTALSSGPGDESLGMGVADSLHALLSAVPGFVLRAAPCVLAPPELARDPLLAARELRADWIVDGGLNIEREHVRISARLLRSADGSAVWHGNFHDKVSEIFTVQETIATRLVEKLRPADGTAASLARARPSEEGGTRKLDAYRLYLAALVRYQWGRPADVREAVGLLNRALEIDPDYALAWTLLAQCHRQRLLSEEAEPADAFRWAKPALERALLLEPNLARARAEQGFMRWWYEFDWGRSEAEFRAAIATNPNTVAAHLGLAMLLLCTQGKLDEGFGRLRTACALDPTCPILMLLQAHFLVESGRLEDGAARAGDVLRWHPDWSIAREALAQVRFAHGEQEAGLSLLRTSAARPGTTARAKARLGFHLARLGRREEARAVLDELLAMRGTRFVPPTATAAVQAALGDTAAALSSLELAAAVRDHRIVCANGDPDWNALRREPRFIALLKRLNLDGYARGLSLL